MASDNPERTIGDLRIVIDRDTCIGSGNCTKMAPEVFDLDEDAIADFRETTEPIDRETLLESCRVCPVDALLAYDADGNRLV